MLDLHAISYQNIWPFHDRKINIFFDEGKYLIKAPIGSGKSFLFFDGPMYGLYKYSARNLVNIHSETGMIKLRFEIDEHHFLVIRNLKKWKNKDSCSSKLFSLSWKDNLGNNARLILEESDEDIELILKEKFNFEEISFKNESDLQKNLADLLPPREVFMSTIFLMQDADNIFELMPADRLNVLKNIFGLMWIDEAKDKIAEKKRAIYTELKIKWDTSSQDTKLKEYVQKYLELKSTLQESPLLASVFETKEESLLKLEDIAEKINISEFSLDDLNFDITNRVDTILKWERLKYQKQEHELESKKKLIYEIEEKVSWFKKIIQESEIKIKSLDQKILLIDPKKIQEAKKEKSMSYEEQVKLEEWVNYQTINQFWTAFRQSKLLQDWDKDMETINLSLAYYFVDFVIKQGRFLKEENNTFDAKLKSIEQLKKFKKEKKETLVQELEKIKKRLTEFDQATELKSKFHCEEIKNNCPFVKKINKASFETIEKQRINLEQEKESLEAEIKKQSLEKEEQWTWLEFQKEIDERNEILSQMRDFLNLVNRKDIQTKHEIYQNLDRKKIELDKLILELEKEADKLGEYKLELERIVTQIKWYETQIKIEDTKLLAIKEEITILVSGFDPSLEKDIEQLDLNCKALWLSLNQIKTLVIDFKDIQLQIKKLKEDEKVVWNLYQIFSKELLLLVLEDSLPVLADIVNSFLSQVVDYQINFFLSKSSSDKLELEAKIYDEKWEREVKSLSGGQKIILKLVWMLAISSYVRSPMLFLDETINNLDLDTVGKVADMLSDFVKQGQMKLYTVTHSQQIQEMDIWDDVIEID